MPSFPLIIDAADGTGVYSINLGSQGTSGVYIKNATDRYVYIEDNSGENFVYKTTDNGVTWTKQDAAGSPAGLQRNSICLCSNGSKIRLVAINFVGESLALWDFDTDTDTWAMVDNTLPVPPIGVFNQGYLCVMVGTLFYLVGQFFKDPVLHDVNAVGYVVFNGTSWSSYTAIGFPGFDSPVGMSQCCLLYTGSSLMCYMTYSGGQSIPPPGVVLDAIYQANLLISPAISIIPQLTYRGLEGNSPIPWQACATGGMISMAVLTSGGFEYGTGTDSGSNPSYTFTTVTQGNGLAGFTVGVVSGTAVLFDSVLDTDPTVLIISYAPNGIGLVEIGRTAATGTSFGLSAVGTGNLNFFAIGFGASTDYWEQVGIIPPPPTPAPIPKAVGGGGTYFPRALNKTLLLAQIARIYGTDWALLRDIPFPPLSSFFLFPNSFDLCLSREFQLYNHIDPLAMSCARKPDCFLQSERDWLDYPPGWITFNPVKTVPLPAPGDGDVVVLSFRVPYGYDGAILAQFHGFTQGFTEGSGDIQWRIRADGRYLRDCGDMELTIGSPKQLSPVYGGLQLRSGNLVEYVVSAPNTSGLLPPPGTGTILTGLHGLFYPRM